MTDLYQADELTGAVNRIIEDMNHRFLISVLNTDFKSHDLGSSAQIERKRAAMQDKESVLDQIDRESVTKRLMEILYVKNKDERSAVITEAHIYEIKEYLKMLDLILDCPQEGIGTNVPIENIIFTQLGMRYCQAQALVHSLINEEKCRQTEFEYGDIMRKVVLYRGENQMINGIEYINVEEYLEKL